MANIKWSGIEQKKYGLTARWYVSAKYGTETDVEARGLYDPSTNATGWGGPVYPFGHIDQFFGNYSSGQPVIVDSGYYKQSEAILTGDTIIVGDGNVILENIGSVSFGANVKYNNVVAIASVSSDRALSNYTDCTVLYSNVNGGSIHKNSMFIECTMAALQGISSIENCTYLRCSGNLSHLVISKIINIVIIDSPSLKWYVNTPRPVGVIADYSVIIGTVSSQWPINGKTSGITVEDFKQDGNYFGKSFSEVDLWGNVEGSGATLSQLQEIFNSYFSPVYLDNWQYLDLSLKQSVDDRIRYGGLGGHFIGALPVGYSYDITTLWATYQDAGNTSNVEIDSVSGNLVLSAGQTTGVFTTTEIVLPNAVEADVSMFFKNNVFDSNGVAVQRLDKTDDPAAENSTEQRTVYSYRLKTSPDSGTALGVWKEYELDRAPTVDASGNSNINDSFDKQTETTQIIKKFALEITLRDLS